MLAAGFLVAGIGVYAFSRASMYGEFDRALATEAQTLAALTRDSRHGVRFQFPRDLDLSRDNDPFHYQVWSDGRVVARSAGTNLPGYVGMIDQAEFRNVMLPNSRPGRLACLTFEPKYVYSDDEYEEEEYDHDDEEEEEDHDRRHRRSPDVVFGSHGDAKPAKESGVMTLTWEQARKLVTIAVARDTTEIKRRLGSLRWILGSVGAAVTLLGSLLLVLVVRRGLTPVESVTSALSGIDENSLAERLPDHDVPVEIAPLVQRLNELLARLEDAFHHERAFSASLAHELRTPLAGLKSTLEVYLARLHEPEEYQEAMQVCLQICDQSHDLVENLLALSRVEGKKLSCQYEMVDIAMVFNECWKPLADEAEQRGLRTGFEIPSAEIRTDREMLRIILRNVLSNAVSYCDSGGDIAAETARGGSHIALTVSNSGNELSPEDAHRVFDRLWRGDRSRYKTGEHFGLGLTLTKRFVEALGGNVGVRVDTRFHLSITLPV